ncbi:cytochrome c oxidase accessory protein CcoG [Neptunomonas sp. XY-337]|uniref:cytochrome c oxidase accessory protein CcoG n=1 Tax=Neptunomonas sp. XY-337 TaxID=2561897 RepID=UPI0010AA7D7C|nr:cytochrome c oxidase accessory protein CcoG [Neptunomonas sp. XY-337]
MQKIPVQQVDPVALTAADKIHVRLTEGRFQNLRRFISWPLMFAYFALVWVQFDGRPWLLFDFAERHILLFGNTLSWHDLPALAGIMIAGACLLFFLAVGWGRVWCGFACPQSIWTWVFIRIERWTEGRATERAKNEKLPLRSTRLARRVAKHLLWIAFATLTAITFTGYFIPVRELTSSLLTGTASLSVIGWLICMAALTYTNAGLVREKICLHACPYSRFQGVMFDLDTRTVMYDAARGEPRRGAESTQGDCIDCGICVKVCPTGIDIRDGLQAACIDCGACIDACDAVMEKIKKPLGLIRFASEKQLQKAPSPIYRPRLAGYFAVLTLAVSGVVYGLQQPTELLVEIRRDRGALFYSPQQDVVCNRYLIKIENFGDEAQFSLSLESNLDARLEGKTAIATHEMGQWLPYSVCATEPEQARQKIAIAFTGLDVHVTKETTFITAVR